MAQKISTTHTLLEHELVLYQRERSDVWQCRYKVDDKWQRTTTKERNLAKAKVKAKDLMIEAAIRKRENLPVITRYFRDVARLAVERMDKELANAALSGAVIKGLATYKDYKDVIKNYLVPCLGKRKITNIDYSALHDLEVFRNKRMGKTPTRSTLLTHNAALNRVFDEAEVRGYLAKINRPQLIAKGAKSVRRSDFSVNEVHILLSGFEAWSKLARTKKIA